MTLRFPERSRACADWFVRHALASFPRALAAIYFIAFASFYPQIPGLLGDNGLAPFSAFAKAVHQQLDRKSVV